MAIYHFSIKAFSRSKGQSATAAAAYRSGTVVEDRRTGEVHDFTRKQRVSHQEIVMPARAGDWRPDRSELWSAAELAENRKDSCVAREHEVAFPVELKPDECVRLAQRYARLIAELHGCAVDIGLHDLRGGNPHGHFLCTTREAGPDGLGEKCAREKAGRKRSKDLADERRLWADAANAALAEAGHTVRVDHRSLKDQGIEREPTIHEGPAVTAARRRGDAAGLERAEHNDRLRELNALRAALAEVDAEIEAEQARLAAEAEQARRAEEARQAAELAESEQLAAQERLRAEQAERRRLEAELLAKLSTPSPANQVAPRSGLADELESLAPERRGGGDSWVEYERDGELYRHPEGRPSEVYWRNPSGDWHLQPAQSDEPDGYDYDSGYDYR